jgi:transketolase
VASKILSSNPNFALVLGDISTFGFKNVLKDYPDRAINLGVLEQTMVGVAAGFSLEGITPTVHTIAPFLVERAFEQVKVDFGYQKLPGNLVSVGASFDYSSLGATHHCPGDITVLSSIPDISLFIPGNAQEFAYLFERNWNNSRLNYFRISEFENTKTFFPAINQFTHIKKGELATVIAVGPVLELVIDALKDIDLEILYINSIDTSKSLSLQGINSSQKLIIIEPYFSGLISSQLADFLMKNSFYILSIGVKKMFIDRYGTKLDLLRYVQLDPKSIRNKVVSFLQRM